MCYLTKRIAQRNETSYETNWLVKNITWIRAEITFSLFIMYILLNHLAEWITMTLKCRSAALSRPSLTKCTMQFRYGGKPRTCTLKCSALTLCVQRCVISREVGDTPHTAGQYLTRVPLSL